MKQRTLIFRECPDCKVGAFVRKDGAGKNCRSCRAKRNIKNAKFKDISGKRYGKLLALSPKRILNDKSFYWECLCDCGNKINIHGNRLRSHKTRSCGCITKSRKGLSTSLIYKKWRAMNSRCYNTKDVNYKNYGARGIKVCDAWRNSFEQFCKDMGDVPTHATLDRIDCNGNYELSNCRWATPQEQSNNRRNNCRLNCFGLNKTLTEWADEYNINWNTLRKRIFELEWPIEKALTTNIRKRKKK